MTQEREGDPPAGGAPPPDPPSPAPERRKKPVVHPAAPAPLPKDYAFTFFDPNDAACREILLDPRTTVPQLFAILRQWVPQVQHNVDVIGNEILRRGCHVNDRDGLTDMTLLHYACKAGAHGVGDPAAAVRLSTRLLALGGDVTLRSRWTHMNALHYAAYFDVPELIRTLLRAAAPRVLHSTCSDFSHGTALHIAASNLCLGAVRCLLEHGADPALRNSKGQVAAEVVPDPTDMALDKAEAALAARELRRLLLDAVPLSCSLPRVTLPNYDNLPGNLMLLCLGLQLGDRVRIDGGKVGTLRFCGTTAFASGQWAGVELDEPEGKNDGSVGGVRYFICPPKQGVFASVSKISKAEEQPPAPSPPRSPPGPPAPAPPKARKDKRAGRGLAGPGGATRGPGGRGAGGRTAPGTGPVLRAHRLRPRVLVRGGAGLGRREARRVGVRGAVLLLPPQTRHLRPPLPRPEGRGSPGGAGGRRPRKEGAAGHRVTAQAQLPSGADPEGHHLRELLLQVTLLLLVPLDAAGRDAVLTPPPNTHTPPAALPSPPPPAAPPPPSALAPPLPRGDCDVMPLPPPHTPPLRPPPCAGPFTLEPTDYSDWGGGWGGELIPSLPQRLF